MAGLVSRVFRQGVRVYQRSLTTTAAVCAERTLPDPMDLATGPEKKELEAIASGNTDPWNYMPIIGGPGTKDQPTMVPSCNDRRLCSHLCDPDMGALVWFWLHKDEPKRCSCGHWFKLYYKPSILGDSHHH